MSNKADLVNEVATASGLTKKAAAATVDAVFCSISNHLAKKESVQVIGFGTFETRERNARKGRNPRTGEEIDIAATTVPAFKPGKDLKDALNG